MRSRSGTLRIEIQPETRRRFVLGRHGFLRHVERLAHRRLVHAVEDRRFLGDLPGAEMLQQRLLKAVPTVLVVALDDVVEIPQLIFTQQDRLPRPQPAAHDFRNHHAPTAHLRREPLADHVAQRIGQPLPDLHLLFRAEHPDHPVYRLRRADRVQRGKNHVSRLRRRQRDLHRLTVADFSHEDHLWSLPQRRPQAHREIRKILPHLPLAERRFLVRMQKLNRIFQRHHVDFLLLVQFVEHRRQRRRLAAAGRSRHKNNPGLLLDDLLENRRQPQSVARRNLRAELPHHDRVIPVVLENVHAETREARDPVARVAGAELFQIRRQPLIPRHQLLRDRLHVRPLQRLAQPLHSHRAQFSIHLHLRRAADHEEQIGHACRRVHQRRDHRIQRQRLRCSRHRCLLQRSSRRREVGRHVRRGLVGGPGRGGKRLVLHADESPI